MDERVPGDKIDHDDDDYHYYDDQTEFKMCQGSLPHKKSCTLEDDIKYESTQ